jgi:hypothetical protein
MQRLENWKPSPGELISHRDAEISFNKYRFVCEDWEGNWFAQDLVTNAITKVYPNLAHPYQGEDNVFVAGYDIIDVTTGEIFNAPMNEDGILWSSEEHPPLLTQTEALERRNHIIQNQNADLYVMTAILNTDERYLTLIREAKNGAPSPF